MIVLKSKWHKPSLRKEFVKRQYLIDILEDRKSLPFTLISAATGFGKSVLASQWLEDSGHRYGWISLDEEHNDPNVLINYLLTILKDQWPEKTFGLETLEPGVNLPSSLIAATFMNDIEGLEEFFVLVLDDYQKIKEQKIHEIFNNILQTPPGRFHLVVLTQRDPPFQLAKMRARFRLNELRMTDLAFSREEAIKLRELISLATTDEQVSALVSESEGWVTGIMVGLMGMAEGISFEKVIRAMYSGASVISELFDEVVIAGLPMETQKFLVLTALLDRFSEELVCSMVSAMQDPDLSEKEVRILIRNAGKRNLFLIPLDATDEWYRYHDLFRSQLKRRAEQYFSPETVSTIYKTASNWFEVRQLFEEALNYALKSGDMTFALHLFSRFRHLLLNSEQLMRLERLSNRFPEDVRNNNPELLINMAMLQHYNANFDGMRQYLLRAERILNNLKDDDIVREQLEGEYHAVSTYLAYMVGAFENAVEHGEKCMKLLPATTPNFFREQSAGWHAFALQACGRASLGMELLQNEYQLLADADPYFQMRLLQGKLIFYLFGGNNPRLNDDGTSLMKLSSPKNFPGSWVIGIYSIAYNRYMSNQLGIVAEFHDELKKHRFAPRPFWAMHHFFLECLSAMGRGHWNQAANCISESEELAKELDIEPLKGMVNAFKVEYFLRRSDIDQAIQISANANFDPHPPLFFYYIPQLSRVKLLFQSGQEKRAQKLLHELCETGRARHNRNLLIQVYALQAMVHFRLDRIDEALDVLNDALDVSGGTRNIRPFLDYGIEMHNLLKKLVRKQPSNKIGVAFLQVFNAEKSYVHNGDHVPGSNNQNHPLSKRELDILCMVMQGFRNKEIADKLFISLSTVKQHLYRAYQKLEVNNRKSAIKKVRDLELVAE